MGAILGRIKQAFVSTINQTDKLSIKQISRKNLPFLFGWIAMILWMDCYVLPAGNVGETGNLSILSPTNLFSYIYSASTAAFILLFNIKKLLPYLKVSAIVAILGVLSEIIFGKGPFTSFGVVLAAVGLGHIIASTGYGFFMILNNSEKLYSVSIAILLSKAIILLKAYLVGSNEAATFFNIMQIIGLIPILFCIWFYQKADSHESFDLVKKIPLKEYTVLLLNFLVLFFNDFLAPALWHSIAALQFTLNIYHAFGAFTGVIFIFLLQQVFHCNICYSLNFSFAVLTMGFATYMFGNLEGWLLVSTFLFGVSYSMGFISLYYIIGNILKKYRSLKIYRIGILTVALCYALGFSLIKILENDTEKYLSIIVPISIAILLMVFSLTPFFTKVIYSAEWTHDLGRPDVTYGDKLSARLSGLKLSPREIEVCMLLLKGYTLLQTSIILSVKYSTVNTYCTSIYRKLKINSRTELVVKFRDYLPQ